VIGAQEPVVTEAARRALDAEQLDRMIEIFSFTVVVLAAVLILDVVVEIYRMRDRPPKDL